MAGRPVSERKTSVSPLSSRPRKTRKTAHTRAGVSSVGECVLRMCAGCAGVLRVDGNTYKLAPPLLAFWYMANARAASLPRSPLSSSL